MRTAETIVLTDDERALVQMWMPRGHAAARIQTRARRVLKLAEGWRDGEVARTLDVRSRHGLPHAPALLRRRAGGRAARPAAGAAPSGAQRRAARASHRHCLQPRPPGHAHWTLRLLAGKAVELGFVPRISPKTIRHALKKKRAQALAA